MGLSISDVTSRWVSRRINKRNKDCSWGGRYLKVFSDDEYIYSYGRHFKIAKYLGTNHNDKKFFLVNGDTYSSSTSRHQNDLIRQLSNDEVDHAIVSFSALESTGIRIDSITLNNIIDYEESNTIYNIIYNKETKKYYKLNSTDYGSTDNRYSEFPVPEQGRFIAVNTMENDLLTSGLLKITDDLKKLVAGYWHTLSGVLLEHEVSAFLSVSDSDPRKVYARYLARFICGLDEGAYFVAQLASMPSTVTEAYNGLMPDEVHTAMSSGKEVFRQGEWFFVNEYDTKEDFMETFGLPNYKFDKLKTRVFLPKDEKSAHYHQVSAIKRDLDKIDNIYLSRDSISEHYYFGKVYHRTKHGNMSGEHKTLKLSGIYRAYKNTEIRSVQMYGRFD